MSSSLIKRIGMGFLFAPFFIMVVWFGKIPFLIMVMFIALIAQLEFYDIAKNLHPKGAPYQWIGLLTGMLSCWFIYDGFTFALLPLLIVAILLIGTINVIRGPVENSIYRLATTLFGIIYIPWTIGHLLLVRTLTLKEPQIASRLVIFLTELLGIDNTSYYFQGGRFVLLVMISVWSCDTMAYFIGKSFGKHKLAPLVSPKKSIEGAIGGFIFTIIGLIGAKYWFASFLAWRDIFLLGALIGVVAQFGDLIESLLKRDANIKDTSTAIPGHGGILDRFDGMLFVAPLVYYYFKFFVR